MATGTHAPSSFIRSVEDIIHAWPQLKTDEARDYFVDRWVTLIMADMAQRLPILREMLRSIEAQESYRDPTRTSDRKSHESFEAYCRAKLSPMFTSFDTSGIRSLITKEHIDEQ